MTMRCVGFWVCGTIGLLSASAFAANVPAPTTQTATTVDQKMWVNHVQPVLAKSCGKCHGGERQKGEYVVKQGTGVAFMPEDLHSIHIQAPLVNFHMYGLALEKLLHREYYDAKAGAWKIFPPHSDIREARESVRTS